jgi:lysine 2-monooxygenase
VLSDSAITRLMAAIDGYPATKVFLAYHEPWWRARGLRAGRSASDLPLRSCYYFGTERRRALGSAGGNSLLMAAYADDDDSRYWSGYERARTDGPRPAPADEDLAATLRQQLELIHGLRVPEPYWSAVVNWSADPFGAAWHLWNVGARSADLIPLARRPVAGLNLHICGEAWSARQGWVEGALTTAERLMEEVFGLPRPAWLSAGAYLGP